MSQKLFVVNMKSIFTSYLCIILFSSPLCVTAKDKILAYIEQIPPFVIVNKHDISGATIDILKHALSGSDIIINYQEINWARAYLEAQKKPNIILTGLNRTPSREHNFHWLLKLPITYNGQKIFIWRLKNTALGNKKTTMKKAIVAVVLDDYKAEYYKSYVKKLNFKPNIYTVGSRAQAIHLLFKKRVDYILGGELNEAWEVKELGYDVDQIERGPHLPNDNKGLYIALSKHTDMDLVNKIKKAMNKIKNNGDMNEIVNLWKKN